MAGQVLYKAKVPCRVGGAFRRAGEVFYLPRFEITPSFLEEALSASIAEQSAPNPGVQGPPAPGRRRPSK